MTPIEIEKRLEALEKQVHALTSDRGNSHQPSTNKEWVFRIWGSFADDPAFDEAMRHGRKWRLAQRPRAPKAKQKKSSK